MEEVVTDRVATDVVQQMIPDFRRGAYGQGLRIGLGSIASCFPGISRSLNLPATITQYHVDLNSASNRVRILLLDSQRLRYSRLQGSPPPVHLGRARLTLRRGSGCL